MSFTAMFFPFRLAVRALSGVSGLRPFCSRKPFCTTRKFGKPLSELPNAFSACPFSTPCEMLRMPAPPTSALPPTTLAITLEPEPTSTIERSMPTSSK